MPVVLAEIALSPVGLSAAFAAGIISFVSPCVWPLVPAYLSYVSGVSFHDLADQTRRVTMTTGAFVLGFGAVFTALGAGAGAVGDLLTEHRRALEIASGILIVLMGAVLAGFGGMRDPTGTVIAPGWTNSGLPVSNDNGDGVSYASLAAKVKA